MEVIKVGMRLLYDGEPCVVQGLRRISTGEPVEEARKEEFHDIVATLVGQGWEVRLRLTEDVLGRLREGAEEATFIGAEATADAVEERTPIDWELISGGEPTEMEEAIHPPEGEEVDVEDLPGGTEVGFEE